MTELIYKGSVKDIYLDQNDLIFKFSDRYSIFDWGKMPNDIKDKGRSLAEIGNYLFAILGNNENWQRICVPGYFSDEKKQYYKQHPLRQQLKDCGVRTHFIDKTLKDDTFKVKKVNVLRPLYINHKYNYPSYNHKCELIPLEVIFRFGITEGSSFQKRAGDKEYLKSIGLNNYSEGNKYFDDVVVEFSTKLEGQDRYLTYNEAIEISSLTQSKFEQILLQTKFIALKLHEVFSKLELELIDGKFEFAWDDETNLMLVDSIGPDELRLMHQNFQYSKEYLRQFYQASEWKQTLDQYKKQYPNDFREKMILENKTPAALPNHVLEIFSEMYTGLASELKKMVINYQDYKISIKYKQFLKQISGEQ